VTARANWISSAWLLRLFHDSFAATLAALIGHSQDPRLFALAHHRQLMFGLWVLCWTVAPSSRVPFRASDATTALYGHPC